jgi:hypothetical protein
MVKYTFLIKPLFFMFNLLFATWLVFKIEKMSPSDFGRYKYFFDKAEPSATIHTNEIKSLKRICDEYRAGKIDSITLEQKLTKFLNTPKSNKSPR